MGSRDFLERLRPSGTPGAATRSGVPADRIAERSAELEPILALLADSQAEAQRIRAAGRDEAAALLRAGAEQARTIVEEARRAARAERQRAAAEARAAAAADARARLAQAHSQAEGIARMAAERSPALVARVRAIAEAEVERVLAGGP